MKIRFPIALLLVVAVAAGIGWAITHKLSTGRAATTHPPSTLSTHHNAVIAPRRPLTLPSGVSLTAVAIAPRLTIYNTSTATSPRLTLRNPTATGAPLTLLVKSTGQTRVQVYLPTRPNGTMGWAPRTSVKLLATPWLLTIHLRSHSLTVSRAGAIVRTLSIGVGRSVTPTPTGTYFITELLKQPDPTGPYGPYAFGLSAHSGVLKHFGQGGNGQIGIHGTDQPQLIGTDASHGCIRLRNPDIIWLTRRLPLGTPVRISHT